MARAQAQVGSRADDDRILGVGVDGDDGQAGGQILVDSHTFDVHAGTIQSRNQSSAVVVATHASHHQNAAPQSGGSDCLICALAPGSVDVSRSQHRLAGFRVSRHEDREVMVDRSDHGDVDWHE